MDRMKKHEKYGRSKNQNSDEKIELKKEDRPDYLPAETLAVSATLETGRMDLYKRALQLN